MAERIIEWSVYAQRGDTRVTLDAPEGDDEAHAMAAHLIGHGWHHVRVINHSQGIPAEIPRKRARVIPPMTPPVVRGDYKQ
jgi:hypothetical protein